MSIENKKIVCVIPARLGSTRFPRKVLALLKGRPLVQWAYEKAKKNPLFSQVVIAVDSLELLHAVQSFGAYAILTDYACQNGTQRLLELQQTGKIEADIWVNWQADEPYISQETIGTLLSSCHREEEEVWTLKRKLKNLEQARDPNVVKVVCDYRGKALYFSRSCIPFQRELQENLYKHIGIYAYSDEALAKMAHFKPCFLEEAEKLEQLRFLYYGLSIQVHETAEEIFGVNTKEELALAESFCYTE